MKRRILFFLLLTIVACHKKQEEPKPVSQVPAQTTTPPTVVEPTTQANKLSPMGAIKELDSKIETYKTGNNLTPQEVESNRKLKENIIRGTFDVTSLCKLSLDTHWNEIAEKDQVDFVHLMTSLLEKKAILSKEQVKGDDKPYKIDYVSESFLNPEKNIALVITKLSVPSERVTLNIRYKMNEDSKGWKIFDVIVDDASLVDNYKFQFDTIIKKYGYPELVNRMQKKLKEME